MEFNWLDKQSENDAEREKNSCEFIEVFSFKNLTYNLLAQNLFILNALL